MITVAARPKTRWETITLDEDNSFEVELTPPSFETMLANQLATMTGEVVAIRLACITDWRGVFVATERGPQALPFDREALGDLLRDHRAALDKLLGLLRPLFTPLSEASEKNSVAPHAAATSPTPPSTASASAADSPSSPTPSDTPSPS